jgi:UDP-glucose 4-epimerase
LIRALAGKNCLVTGGLGFIGSNLARKLREQGAGVSVVDSLVPTHGGNRFNLHGVEGVDLLVADIGDASSVAPLLERADVVFNLAGQVSHVDSMGDPLTDLQNNVTAHLMFLELCRKLTVRARIVYTSTRQIYGKPRYLPVDEKHPVMSVDVNGICQSGCEQFHLLYGRVHSLDVVILRLTNVFGPRQRIRDDRQCFMAAFSRQAIQQQPIKVFGDGRQRRDCLYVDDAVSALITAAGTEAARNEIINIGNTDVMSLEDIAGEFVRLSPSSTVEKVPWPRDREIIDIGDYYGDYSKAARILGWKPGVSISEGIGSTLEFYRENYSWYL